MTMESQITSARLCLINMHYKAGAAHLGGSLSCVDMLVVLFSQIIGADDVFVLSKGHSASALYAALRSVGRVGGEVIDTFCADGTKLGGHLSANFMPDVPFGTGSLGHGLSLAAGLALGKKRMNAPGRVFCLCSDGEFQEGSIWEAVIFSVHHKLNELMILVDVNGWQGFGSTAEVASLDIVGLESRLRAFGLSVDCADGHNAAELKEKIAAGSGNGAPRVLLAETRKGKGVPCFEGEFVSHYAKLTADQYNEAVGNMEKNR